MQEILRILGLEGTRTVAVGIIKLQRFGANGQKPGTNSQNPLPEC
jgi:hypothetical protein